MIELANDTDYGLGAFVYGTSRDLYSRIAPRLQSGMVSFNESSFLRAFLPFGGYKSSGIGRQHGEHGFHEVTQVKVVTQ
jgi:aldehyde dehydrogenase (NAD+)